GELGIEIKLYHEVFYCTRCSNLASEHTCPHDKKARINISGTGIRELLRHGILPPKEIVRTESARIAMQVVQPKGVDADGVATLPVGKTVKSIFPFYLTNDRLGGQERSEELAVESLTIEDLDAA